MLPPLTFSFAVFSFKLSLTFLSLNIFRDKDAEVEPLLWGGLPVILWNIYSTWTSPTRSSNSLYHLGAQKMGSDAEICVCHLWSP